MSSAPLAHGHNVTVPAWKTALEASLAANAADPTSAYVTLATVRPNGTPAARSIVFRGFWGHPTATSIGPRSNSRNQLAGLPESVEATVTTAAVHPLSASSSSASLLSNASSSGGTGGSTSQNKLVASKLSCLLEFVTDVRSSKCAEIGFGGALAGDVGESAGRNAAEVCWYFAKTREQFRLSGKLYLYSCAQQKQSPRRDQHNPHQRRASTESSKSLPPWAPIDTPFEAERLRLWRSISSALRASFAGAGSAPGTTINTESTTTFSTNSKKTEIVCLPALPPQSAKIAAAAAAATIESLDPLFADDEDIDSEIEQLLLSRGTPMKRRRDASKEEIEIHDLAYSRFGVLALDVDSVDHLVLPGGTPAVSAVEGTPEPTPAAGSRTIHRVVVPERSYSRIVGVSWSTAHVVP